MTQNQIFGYASRLHAYSGQSISFHVSSEGDEPFEAELVRIINGCVDSDHNTYKELGVSSDFQGQYPGREKAVYNGSYGKIVVPRNVDSSNAHHVQFQAFPTALKDGHRQTLIRIKNSDGKCVEVFSEKSRLTACIADTTDISIEGHYLERHWHQIALSWDNATGNVSLRIWRFDNRAHQPSRIVFAENKDQLPCPVLVGEAQLYLAATVGDVDRNGQLAVSHGFDGKIDALRIASKKLNRDEVFAAAAFEPDTATMEHLSGVYTFSAASTASFQNQQAPEQVGIFSNMPRFGVTGARWNGSVHCFTAAPDHYSAIHFHADDLYDCNWTADFSFDVPKGLKSGYYAAKVTNLSGETDYLPFYVTPAPTKTKRAPIALWVPTWTYLAYSNDRMVDNTEKYGFDVAAWNGQIEADMEGYYKTKAHPEFGASLYDYHNDGCGRHCSSWLRPLLNMRPKSPIWGMTADTQITSWLEHCGLEYDVITDHTVHEEGADLLSKYSCVISGNHPEYVSSEILDGLQTYTQDRGGRFIYMGANGYYWATGIDKNYPAAIEIRRGHGGSGAWFSYPGEHYLQSTGQLGGLWRHVGRPPQEIFGVGTRGMGFPGSIGYSRNPDWNNPRAAFLTEGISEEVLGDYGLMGGGAAGEEIDAIDYELGTPDHALVIASSRNHPRGMMIAREDLRFVVPDEWVHDQVRADITFFETLSGGAVLSLSSMTWCGSLSHNSYKNGVSRLSENALRRFIAPEPFDFPVV